MSSQLKELVYNLLKFLRDDQLTSEDGVERGLEKVAILDVGAYESFLKSLVSPPPSISGMVLELVLSCKLHIVLTILPFDFFFSG